MLSEKTHSYCIWSNNCNIWFENTTGKQQLTHENQHVIKRRGFSIVWLIINISVGHFSAITRGTVCNVDIVLRLWGAEQEGKSGIAELLCAAAKSGVIACINDAWETKLAFISLTICTQLCCMDGIWWTITAPLLQLVVWFMGLCGAGIILLMQKEICVYNYANIPVY